MIQRAPRRELAPFVSRLWACEVADGAPGGRELVLPTGAMHLVIRLDEPLRVFAALDAAAPATIGHAVIGGARATAYVRDVSQPVCSVGAQLRPGAAALLLGVPAHVLAEHHTALDDVWGAAAGELRERLAAAGDGAGRLTIFEAALVARLPRVRGVHPAVAHALAQLEQASDVSAVVDQVGYSQRRFLDLFHHAVGLTPKRYGRVQRLQRAIVGMASGSLAAVAHATGFADQAHLTREFRALAGLSPGAYRALAGGARNHVPIKPR